jgi:tRNA pseudouridine55 synthase
MNGEKTYEGEFVFGVRTDTLDGDGKVVSSMETNIQESDVRALIPQFTGTISQIPPMVSAVRHKGRRLYDLAREGKTVEREPKQVTIHSLELLRWTPGPQPRAWFRIVCSRGTYIRKLAEDMGDILGVGAYLSALIRTNSGSFTLDEAHSLDDLGKLQAEGRLTDALISLPEASRRIHKSAFVPAI